MPTKLHFFLNICIRKLHFFLIFNCSCQVKVPMGEGRGEASLSFCPVTSIKTAIAYGFGYVCEFDVLLTIEVGYSAGYL